MVAAEFVIAVRDNEQSGELWDAPPQELDQIQRGFIGPVDIFKHHHGGEGTRLQFVKQSREHHGTRGVATQERSQGAPRLRSNIVQRSKWARGK